MKTNDDFKEIDLQASKAFVFGTWKETCQTCNGNGLFIRMKSTSVGFEYAPETCNNCNGTGEVEYEKPKQPEDGADNRH